MNLRLSERLALYAASRACRFRPPAFFAIERAFRARRSPAATWNLAVTDELVASLQSIPSQATLAERLSLYQHFRDVWSGEDDVLEVGPFLGGTTRAIGLGMLANPRRRPGSQILTCDRFRSYESQEGLLSALRPSIQAGLVTEEEVLALTRDGAFLPLFERLHAGQPYRAFLETSDRPLPESPQADASPSCLGSLSGRFFGTVFVDGAKSWFATRALLRRCADATRAGSVIIFQDYAHYTCFWVPAILALLGDSLRLLWYVDDTYAFVLVDALRKERIESGVPDSPVSLPVTQWEALFSSLTRDADRRGDNHGWVRHQMQLASALAWVGQKEAARSRLQELSRSARAVGHERALADALAHPTYRQSDDGTVELVSI